MKRRLCFTSFLAVFVTFSGAAVASAQISKDAILLITDTATVICGSLQLRSDGYKFEINGTAEAKIAGLIKNIADLGLTGATNFKIADYVEGLNEDTSILQNAQDARKCRSDIFDKLLDRLSHVDSKDAEGNVIVSTGAGSINSQNSNNNNNNIVINGKK